MDQVSEAGGGDDDRSSHSSSSWCLVDEQSDERQDGTSQLAADEHEGSASIISDLTSASSSNNNTSSISSYLSQVLLASSQISNEDVSSAEVPPSSPQFSLPELAAADSDDRSSVAFTRGSSICADDEQETDTGEEETGEEGDAARLLGDEDDEEEDLCVVDEGVLLEESEGASARFIEPGRVAKKLDELADCFEWKWSTLYHFTLANSKLWLPLTALVIALTVAYASLDTINHHSDVDIVDHEITQLMSPSLAPTFELLSREEKSGNDLASSTIAYGDSGLQYRDTQKEEVVVSHRTEEPRPESKRLISPTAAGVRHPPQGRHGVNPAPIDVDIPPELGTKTRWAQIARALRERVEDSDELEQCREELDDAKSSFKIKTKLLQYFRLKEFEQELRIRELENRLAASELRLQQQQQQQLSADEHPNDDESSDAIFVVDADVDMPASSTGGKHTQGKRTTVRLLDRDIDEKGDGSQAKEEERLTVEEKSTCLKSDGLLSNLTRSLLSALNHFPYVNSTSSTLRRLINAEYLLHLNNMRQLSSWLHNHSSQFIKKHGPIIHKAKDQVKDRAIQLWADLPSRLNNLKTSLPEVVNAVKRDWMSRLKPLVAKVETAVTVFKDHLGGVDMSPDDDGDTGAHGGNGADADGDAEVFEVEECSRVQVPKSVESGFMAADVGKDVEAGKNDAEEEEEEERSGEWIYSRAKRRHEMRRRNSSILLRVVEKRAAINWKTDWQWQRAHNRQKHRDEDPAITRGVVDSWLFSRERRRKEARNFKLGDDTAEQLTKGGRGVWKEEKRDWLLDRGRQRSKMRNRDSKGEFRRSANGLF